MAHVQASNRGSWLPQGIDPVRSDGYRGRFEHLKGARFVSTSTIQASEGRQGLLRRVLLADATFSGTTGLILFLGASFLSEPFGLPSTMLTVVGLSLLPFSAGLIYLSSRLDRARGVIPAVIAGNLLWVVASAVVLFSGWIDPTSMGTVFVVAQAIIVALFAELQFFGLRRLG